MSKGYEYCNRRLSKEEVKILIRHFLLSSPPGSLVDVLADVRELVGSVEVLREEAKETLRQFDIEQQIPLRIGGTLDPEKLVKHILVLCKFGVISENEFYDPHISKILTIDHVICRVESFVDAEPEKENIQRRRKLLQKYCDSYLKERYEDGVSTVYPDICNKDEDLYYIAIYNSKSNDWCFWGGRMKSIYKIRYIQSDEGEKRKYKARITGSIHLFCHYYEYGNIQQSCTRTMDETIAYLEDSYPMDVIEFVIFKRIKEFENEFQDSIDRAFQSFQRMLASQRIREPVGGRDYFDFASQSHDLVKNYVPKRSRKNYQWVMNLEDQKERIKFVLELTENNRKGLYFTKNNYSCISLHNVDLKIFGLFCFF